MIESPLLPPALAGAADVAATLSLDSALPDGQEAQGFDAVLQSQIRESSSAEPEQTGEGAAVPEASPFRDGEVLAMFLAEVPGASIPQGIAQRSVPVDASMEGNSSVAPLLSRQEPIGSRALEQLQLEPDLAPESPRQRAVSLESSWGRTSEPAGEFQSLFDATIRTEKTSPPAYAVDVRDPSHAADVREPSRAAVGSGPSVEPAPAPRLPLSASIGSGAWSGQFSDRVVWIAQARQSSAELVLNPPQLGPVEVHVSVSAEQVASLSFHAAHPAVREAIQGSLARLQEAFASSGLQLADVFVGSGAAGSDDRRRAGDKRVEGLAPRGGGDAPMPVGAIGSVVVRSRSELGRVDLFA
jgi:flagellar hook-length control protein FliK